MPMSLRNTSTPWKPTSGKSSELASRVIFSSIGARLNCKT
jgi:hypothetical protein